MEENMKKVTFLKAVEKYHAKLLKNIVAKKFTKDQAEDAVQGMICRLLANKAYTRIHHDNVDGRIYAYLQQAAKYELLMNLREAKLEAKRFIHLPDIKEKDEESLLKIVEVIPAEKEEVECPFCFKSILNKYGACGLCHTILGAGKAVREKEKFDELSIAEYPDFGLFTDVNQAMETLTDLERRIVRHVINGNDTLDDLTELTGASRSKLGRVWMRAKEKLQVALVEYAPE